MSEAAFAARRPGLYSTHVGKKYAMAISGAVLMLFVLVHMLGNLKLYLGARPETKRSASPPSWTGSSASSRGSTRGCASPSAPSRTTRG